MGLFYKKEMKISLPTPRVSFLSPVFSFLPFTKTLERVFQSFSSSNLGIFFRKTHSEVLFQGKKNSTNVFRNIYSKAKKEDRGGRKETWVWGKKFSKEIIMDLFKKK
jgi:hypothetical protein